MRDPLEPTRTARGGRRDPNGPRARLGHGRMGPQHGAPPQLGPNRVFRRFGATCEILGVRAPVDPPMTRGSSVAIFPMRGAPNTPWAFDRALKGVVEGWVCPTEPGSPRPQSLEPHWATASQCWLVLVSAGQCWSVLVSAVGQCWSVMMCACMSRARGRARRMPRGLPAYNVYTYGRTTDTN